MFQHAKFYLVQNENASSGPTTFSNPNIANNGAQQQQGGGFTFGFGQAARPIFNPPQPPQVFRAAPIRNAVAPLQQLNPVLQHQCKIIPCPSPIVSQATNIKACRGLKNRLFEKLEHDQWGLKTEFKAFKLESPASAPQTDRGKHFSPDCVVVSGQILEKLHSIMLYNTENARLKIKLTADLVFKVSDGSQQRASSGCTVTTLKYETELFPHLGEGQYGHYDHSKYSSAWKGPIATTNYAVESSMGAEADVNFQVRNVNISVEGTEFDLNYKTNPNSVEGHKKLLETGLCFDITIITKDEMEIPCHKLFLIGQSSVLETMLKGSTYLEAKTSQISMDRTKEEVMAFLEFLYYGGLEGILDDTALVVSLYEMGNYYDVKRLEKALRSTLLSRPADSFDVDTALRMFHIASGSGNSDLRQKAADVLETKNNDDILSSSTFQELSPEAVNELFVISRRRF